MFTTGSNPSRNHPSRNHPSPTAYRISPIASRPSHLAHRASLILFLLPLLLTAQTKLLTVEDATGMNPKLVTANLSQLQWMGNSEKYCWVAKNTLVRGSVQNETRDSILKLDVLNAAIRGIVPEPLKRFPALTFLDENTVLFSTGNTYIRYGLVSGIAQRVNSCDAAAENTDLDKATFKIAFTRGNNLYISFRDKETAVTAEPNPGIVYGASRVHRNEFGIDKGTFWSPGGRYLAFYRMDETMVTDYPLVDVTTRIAEFTPVKYPMAGMKSHRVTLGVYDVQKGRTIYLKTDPSGLILPGVTVADSLVEPGYLTNITWSPDEQFIYIACLNRDQNHMQLNKFDAVSGAFVKTLFEEKSDRYVEPLHGPVFLNGDPGRFIWQSQRDGYNHLYLYDTEGNLVRQLTSGPWVVQDFVKLDEKNTTAWFYGNRTNPLVRQLYSAGLKKGEPILLTPAAGTHNAQVSGNGKFILDTYSSFSIPRRAELLDDKGRALQVLLAAESPLKDYKLGRTSVFTVKGEGNTDLYCRLIRPEGFDSTKKYPVIIYVYGGPHSQMITDTWLGGGGLFLNYLADKGYVVFTLDNRGTQNRGRDFEQAIHRNLGVAELADQMAGVKYLKSLPWVDSTRIGINGWSYGGFMTITMMLKSPGTFKVGVCGGPVTDWQYYEVMYGERYMDTPQSNPEGYRNACLMNYVKDLRGKLLIIHDYQDETVVPQNSLVFLKKCVDEGKQVDYFIYPGHEHNVRGKDRVHLNQKMVQYFDDFL